MLVHGLAILVGIAASRAAHATSWVRWFMLMFESDNATLDEKQKAELDQLLMDEAFRGKKLIITGHYDRTGSPEHRTEMSRRFAEAVRDYLVATGHPPDTLTVYWRGDSSLAKRSVTIQPRCC